MGDTAREKEGGMHNGRAAVPGRRREREESERGKERLKSLKTAARTLKGGREADGMPGEGSAGKQRK